MQMLYIVAAGGTIDGTIHPKVARMMPALARAALEHEHDAQSEGDRAQARARALPARGRYIPTVPSSASCVSMDTTRSSSAASETTAAKPKSPSA